MPNLNIFLYKNVIYEDEKRRSNNKQKPINKLQQSLSICQVRVKGIKNLTQKSDNLL